MMKWIKPPARNLCILAMLLAPLTGCEEKGDTASEANSTFPTVAVEKSITPPVSTGGSDEVVIGTVTPVPATQEVPPPEPTISTNGERTQTPSIELQGPEIVVVTDPLLIIDGGKLTAKEPEVTSLPVKEPEKVTRFVTTSPDTIEYPTFGSSPAYQYNLGNLVATDSKDSVDFTNGMVLITPIKGWVRYPVQSASAVSAAKYPVIIFLHGNHSPNDPSYKGYDYLAENLAPHGYIVLSIDANAINPNDRSSQARGQLVLGTLDRLRQINEHGQVDKKGNAGALNILRGKMDFDRIGIMGHSRGGQGIANAIKFNKSRRGASYAGLVTAMLFDPDRFKETYPDLVDSIIKVDNTGSLDEQKFKAAIARYNLFYSQDSDTAAPYSFKGAFLLAPTDFGGNTDLNGVPLATLLPMCDGDMSNLQGAISYDHNRLGNGDDTAPRYQIAVHGANHNYYNTIWIDDDSIADSGPKHCLPNRADTIRVNDEDQRRDGLFLINSFMRHHVGGEEKFATWWKGMAKLPDAACPAGRGPCDERVVLTIQKNEHKRKLIQYFAEANSLQINSLGGAVVLTGFDDIARCEMPSGASIAGNCTPNRLSGFEFAAWDASGLRSIAEHAELAWSKAGATITNNLMGISAASHDTLTFRIAVVRPMGQEVLVTLTDNTGKQATIEASDFSGALYNAPRTKAEGRPMIDDPIDKPYSSGQVKMLLNMVAIPLKAFQGVDTMQLKALNLAFPKESGKVAIADIQFQTFEREQFGPRLVAVSK